MTVMMGERRHLVYIHTTPYLGKGLEFGIESQMSQKNNKERKIK